MSRCALLFALLACSAASAAEKPNVVFILADDLGWTDLGCQRSRYYETPNIDRLAAEGLRFTNGYSCGPNCRPTRAAPHRATPPACETEITASRPELVLREAVTRPAVAFMQNVVGVDGANEPKQQQGGVMFGVSAVPVGSGL
jgi:hypothetical protein